MQKGNALQLFRSNVVDIFQALKPANVENL